MTWTAPEVEDTRRPLDMTADERTTLRWILTHLVEEYARHLGHMDLLRGAIDGRTGY